MGKEKFPTNVRHVATDVQEEEQSRFTGRTIKTKKHLQGPIVREEASPERGLPQLEDLSIIPAKGCDVNTTSSAVSQVVQARTDAIIRGGEGESDSAQVSEIILAESHARLFNLCLVILIAINSRLIIENLMKYGLLIQAGFWFSSRLTLPVFPIFALLVEKLKLYTPIFEKFVAALYLIITTAGILYFGYVIHRVQSAVLSGLILILIAVTRWMKLVSYAHTNANV
ncbi:unnamed protein product [Sphagnum troendelagicum]|uniref:diacylglycerol O-acyltransferase n=1 Tax=Sphagnum troendelagicum TaxID=128251 RepID=A0ABP0TP73_9BRYO